MAESELNGSNPAARFKAILEETAKLSRSRVAAGELGPGELLLSEWQVQRLRCTYEDFSNKKRYRKAVDFFLTDIYGPKDFSQRDQDIARIYPLMIKVLSSEAIASLARGLEINTLTMKLDAQLLQVLVNDLGLNPILRPQELNFDLYSEAYRLCDNYDERRCQIESIVTIGNELELLTRKKMILAAVKVARKPAQLAGFGELQSFIERGLSAFRAMGKSQQFLQAIRDREVAILDAIYANQAVPDWVRVE